MAPEALAVVAQVLSIYGFLPAGDEWPAAYVAALQGRAAGMGAQQVRQQVPGARRSGAWVFSRQQHQGSEVQALGVQALNPEPWKRKPGRSGRGGVWTHSG